ncbi:MAG: glycosyltransferase [Propionibacteriales bacterium]|nr:glycosyltransferase [Propionibacteriales bacterium]
MSHRPHISVCIPVHQGEPYLANTVEHVLRQEYDDFEIVVLDNQSTDGTADILHRYVDDPRIRIHQTDRLLPLQENWRRVVDLSRGELIKLVCADDLIADDALRSQSQILDEDPGVSLVACRRDLVDETGQILTHCSGLVGLLGRRNETDVVRRIVQLGMNPIGEASGVMFRRRDYEAVGGWDLNRYFVLDLDLWVRLLAHGDLIGQPEVLAAFRLGEQGLSAGHTRQQFDEHAQYIRMLSDTAVMQPHRRDRLMSRVMVPLAWQAWALRQIVFRLRRRRSLGDRRPVRPNGHALR